MRPIGFAVGLSVSAVGAVVLLHVRAERSSELPTRIRALADRSRAQREACDKVRARQEEFTEPLMAKHPNDDYRFENAAEVARARAIVASIPSATHSRAEALAIERALLGTDDLWESWRAREDLLQRCATMSGYVLVKRLIPATRDVIDLSEKVRPELKAEMATYVRGAVLNASSLTQALIAVTLLRTAVDYGVLRGIRPEEIGELDQRLREIKRKSKEWVGPFERLHGLSERRLREFTRKQFEVDIEPTARAVDAMIALVERTKSP